MKRVFQYKNKKVCSFSKKNIKGKFRQKELEISNTDYKKIMTNLYDLFIRRGKLVFEKRDTLLAKEKIENQKKIIEKVGKGIATKEELATLLSELLNKQYGENI